MSCKKTTGVERLITSKERKKEKSRETSRRNREKNDQVEKGVAGEQQSSFPFCSQMAKKRSVDRVKAELPTTPEKRAAVIKSLVESPTTNKLLVEAGVVLSEQQKVDLNLFDAFMTDATSVIEIEKTKRNDNSRKGLSMGISMLCGETVKSNGLTSAASSALGINRRRLAISIQKRATALSNRESAWVYTQRKTRCDALTEEQRRLAFDFWSAPGVSRPTGNKNDVKRKRLGPNDYVEHEKHILEKTQSEVFHDFKAKFPDVQMKQRAFEMCKPYFVVPARPQDRNSCCCRQHVELRSLFKSCMDFRRRIISKNAERRGLFIVYESLNSLVDDTLCESNAENRDEFKSPDCLHRSCPNCGTGNLRLMPEEKIFSHELGTVKWEKFEYIDLGEKRKLKLVQKETSPAEMFAHFLALLETFPAHQFRAQWQHKQMKNLLDNLPLEHVCCIHDYSENYACQQQDQIQSMYYGQTQASIHVTVLHRHALFEIDGEQSTEEDTRIVTEHLFTISEDLSHDHHSVHACRVNVANYLRGIKYKVDTMHEWTDGCSAQYKSRHCMGDVSYSKLDFGFTTIRNYFETSHAKGPQDGAGANLKHKADMAVIRREVVIQNAKDLFDYA